MEHDQVAGSCFSARGRFRWLEGDGGAGAESVQVAL